MRRIVGLLLAMVAISEAGAAERPIVFVHGNGDSAALWIANLWRFESNGYDAALLFALDMPHPSAPAEDARPEPNRSTTREQRETLAAAVSRVLAETGAEKVVLVGSSRGGNAIRDYLRNAGGADRVALAILCGTPNHGVSARPVGLGNEFNGMGPFLSGLNAPSEVVPGVDFVTIRSDRNDKYAQPTGEVLGYPGEPTGVSFDGPALEGATNIVLPGLDHREVAFHELAFREQYRAITGREPVRLAILAEAEPVLDGVVSGYENEAPTNLPVAGARVEIYEVEAGTGVRKGKALRSVVTDATGRFGPFRASPDAYYELVVAANGFPTMHVYRSPFPRSSRYVNLRLEPLEALAGKAALERGGSVVRMTRPRGYFGHGRDRFTIDSKVPEGVAEGVPATSAAVASFDASPSRSVTVVFNDEAITVRTFPLGEGHVSIAELTY